MIYDVTGGKEDHHQFHGWSGRNIGNDNRHKQMT